MAMTVNNKSARLDMEQIIKEGIESPNINTEQKPSSNTELVADSAVNNEKAFSKTEPEKKKPLKKPNKEFTNLIKRRSSARGVPKTVYLQREVYDFLVSTSPTGDESSINFSYAINQLCLLGMEKVMK